MSFLASLVFVMAAAAAMVSLRMTFIQNVSAALTNVHALRTLDNTREFRFEKVTVVAQPASGDVVRMMHRTAPPRVIRSSARLRAAA